MKRRYLLVILGLLLAPPMSWAQSLESSELTDPILPDSAAIESLPLPTGFNTRTRTDLSAEGGNRAHIKSKSALHPANGTAAVVDAIALNPELLRASGVALSNGGAAFESAGESGLRTLVLEGSTYELAFLSQAVDAKFGFRHVTARVLNKPDSYARFSVDGNGLVVGTVRTPQATYRIVPDDSSGQLVYRFQGPADEPRTKLTSAEDKARKLEQRHLQLAQIAEIRPELVQTSEEGGTLFIRGGRLGSLPSGKTDATAVAEVLERFSALTLVSQPLELRIKEVRVRGTIRRIEFEQTINGIPVWRRNVLRVGPDKQILEVRTRFVTPGRAPNLPAISQQHALTLAERAIEEKTRMQVTDLELLNPAEIRYRVVPHKRDLVLQYWFDTTSEVGVWRVIVDAHTGVAEATDPSQPADAFGYHICRDVSSSQDPRKCSDPGAELIWANPYGGSQSCTYHSPMGGGICVGGSDAGRSHTALLNADRALREIHLANPEYCCDLLGGPDRIVDLVYQTSGATSSVAHYNPATESLMTPVGDTSFRSVESVWHEFGHHVLHMYNPQVSALYEIPGEEFATAFNESFADLMSAGLALLNPSISGLYGNPWIVGDGLDSTIAARNLADTTLSFVVLVQGTYPPHERGRAISSFFYQVKVTSGISDRRFMELLLEFADRFEDFNDDGLDLIDLENTLHTVVRPGEGALRNAINIKFEAMYAPLPGDMPAPIPPGQPPSAGAPPPPSPVSAEFLECGVTSSGFPATRWVVRWTASPGATYYGAYLRAPYIPFPSDMYVGPELSRIAVIWGVDRFGLLATSFTYVAACNQSNVCSSISNAVLIRMLPQCEF